MNSVLKSPSYAALDTKFPRPYPLIEILKSLTSEVNYGLYLPKSRKFNGSVILILSIIVLLLWATARTSRVTGQTVVCPTSNYELPAIQLIPIATTTVNGCATTVFSTVTQTSTQPATQLPAIPGFPVASILGGLVIGLILCLILRRRQGSRS
jgi:hypothetical protein